MQLTVYTLNVFETMLKEESLLKIFYECSIESNSVAVKEFTFNKLKCMFFIKSLHKCCSEYCENQATIVIHLMPITCYKIGSNNFTKLTNRLDEVKKCTAKEAKDIVKNNKHQNQCHSQSTNDNENDMSKWKTTDLVNHLKKIKLTHLVTKKIWSNDACYGNV